MGVINVNDLLLRQNEKKIFFETEDGKIKIIHDDFITTNLIEENSIDLIITSPPYNVNIHYNSFSDDREVVMGKTQTYTFGASKREAHDSTLFYSRELFKGLESPIFNTVRFSLFPLIANRMPTNCQLNLIKAYGFAECSRYIPALAKQKCPP